MIVVGADGEVRFANAAAGELVDAGRPRDRRADPVAAAAPPTAARRRERRAAGRRPRLRGQRAPAAGRATRCWPWSATAPRSCAARSPSASSSPTRPTSCATRSPGSRARSRCCAAGAKDDPEAREHFLDRLREDAERISRLTESLLTLARMEAVGEGGAEALDVALAVEEAAEAVARPTGSSCRRGRSRTSSPQGDRVLLRQVLIGLLTNAFKNTPAPGDGYPSRRAGRAEGEERDRSRSRTRERESRPAELDRVFERFYRGSGSLRAGGLRPRPLDRQADGRRDGRRDRRRVRGGRGQHLLGAPARRRSRAPTPVA